MIICYTVPEMWRVTDVIFIFHFGIFFPFYPSNNPSRFSGIDACNTILFQIKFFGRKIKENTLAIHLIQITALFSLT